VIVVKVPSQGAQGRLAAAWIARGVGDGTGPFLIAGFIGSATDSIAGRAIYPMGRFE